MPDHLRNTSANKQKSSPNSLFAGLDVGTSGARVILVDRDLTFQADGKASMIEAGVEAGVEAGAELQRPSLGDRGNRQAENQQEAVEYEQQTNLRNPDIWWCAARLALERALAKVDRSLVVALCVDATSGTLLPVDVTGKPLADGLMYNDACSDQALLKRIANLAPQESATHGPTGGLAKAIQFQGLRPASLLHQADWIAFQFSGIFATDENNALKTGYDPIAGVWPEWLEDAGLDVSLLPAVQAPGDVVGLICSRAADAFGLPRDVRIIAGTTDGCASFLATGASEAGEGVTALGTTLTLKLLSDRPIFAPEAGIYSHKLLGRWLAGGASNTGGVVLLNYFSADAVARLSTQIDPDSPSELDYYPLARPGERFPISDPTLAPRAEPRPDDDIEFLKGLLDGISRIEALGYRKLAEWGGPELTSVRSVGGGAKNAVWTRLREKRLGVRMLQAQSEEAAYGVARLAKIGSCS